MVLTLTLTVQLTLALALALAPWDMKQGGSLTAMAKAPPGETRSRLAAKCAGEHEPVSSRSNDCVSNWEASSTC